MESLLSRHIEYRSPPRVLIVDDEPRVGKTMLHSVEACGFGAGLAISAAAFRARYDEEGADFILLDLSLPGGDGIELLRYMAEREARPLILIVSGSDRRVVEAAERYGIALGLRMGGALTKPLTLQQIERALRGAEARAASAEQDDELCIG